MAGEICWTMQGSKEINRANLQVGGLGCGRSCEGRRSRLSRAYRYDCKSRLEHLFDLGIN